MKVAYILRGIPGSGKTTLAKILAEPEGVIHSTDDYFYQGGVYRFQPERLPEFHEKNFAAFVNSLRAEIPIVVCDNVNREHRDYRRYVYAAREHGYRAAIVFLPHPSPDEATARTVHAVPIQTILRIIERWEY